jgi:prefoldin subunit 5
MKNWLKEHEHTITTLVTAIGLWFAVTHSFNRDFEKLDKIIDKLDKRLTNVENRIIDIDKRLTSVETILLIQGKIISAEIEKNDSFRNFYDADCVGST